MKMYIMRRKEKMDSRLRGNDGVENMRLLQKLVIQSRERQSILFHDKNRKNDIKKMFLSLWGYHE
jgi:hypothetical protein